MQYKIRKWVACVEEVLHDGHSVADEPMIKAAVGVIFANPFADDDAWDLTPLTVGSDEIGTELGRRGQLLLGGRSVQSYGKGGIVGTSGEQEHAVACVTSVFGDALRASVGGGLAWISSVTKVGGPGATIDLPLAHKDALYVRSHYDAVTLSAPDGPLPGEIMICAAFATGGRIHQRSGGPTADNLVGDGLR